MLSQAYSKCVTSLVFAVLGVLVTPTRAQTPLLPAFPGADGAAAEVTGGRGGTVYHVTKLDKNFSDAGPGTLRYGMDDANFGGQPRTIVFDVAGTFWLGRYGAERGHDNGWDTQSRLNLGSNVTIAGQTAPGPVHIMGGVVKAGGDNTILRNVTIAPGYGLRNFAKPEDGIEPTPGDFPDSYTYDAIDISGTNQMFDHLTTVYATDETISANEFADKVTIQYTTIAQAQNYPQADAEGGGRFTGHALGSLLQAGSNAEISVVNNLYAHLKGRLPRVGSEVGSGALNDFRNNVFYNWFGGALEGGPSSQPSKNNFIENFYLAGPGGQDVSGPTLINRSGGTSVGSAGSQASVFESGNVRDSNKDGDAADAVPASYGGSHASPSQAYDIGIGVTTDALTAYDNVLDHVGANWWNRGIVDNRLISEVRAGTGRIVGWADDPFDDSPTEGTEWRTLLSYRADPTTGAAPFSRASDWDEEAGGGDGMPSWWEREHGLDPLTADNNGDFDDDGYTNLEEYLNEIAAWPAPGTIVFNGSTNNRFAQIQNWRVSGVSLPVQGIGTQPTFSNWQPSRYDTVRVEGSAVVDAVGQHAGTLQVEDGASLTVTDGWLKVADSLQTDANATLRVEGGELQAALLTRSAAGDTELVGGKLRVDGVDFDLSLDGSILAPGFQTEELVIDGSLTVNSGGLEVSISPTDGSTAVFVMGDATLGGDLLVSLLDFNPAPTDEYLILSATSISGVFDNVINGRLSVDGGGSFRVLADATTLKLDDYLGPLAGDFNSDGVVDAADYTVWRDGLGTTYTQADYSVWAANYGASSVTATAVTTSVPEPTSLITLLGAVVLASVRRNASATKTLNRSRSSRKG